MFSFDSAKWASFIAAMPVLIWTHDSFYTVCRVRGTSMDPTLKDGDIILMRRSDNLLHQKLQEFMNKRGEGEEGNGQDEVVRLKKEEERQRVKIFERNHCSQMDSPIWFVKKPPIPATGDVVVFCDPTEYPPKWNIKRVIGLGGQVLMMPSCRYDKQKPESGLSLRYRMDDNDQSMRTVTPSVPPYSLWIEGDNTATKQIDSKSHGPVSKKLVVGIAEYVLWPPSRIGTPLLQNKVVDPSKQPRAYWP